MKISCCVLLTATLVAGVASAQMPGGQPSGMPDVRMMSGIPMPMADVPDGTVVVRVVRGELTDAIADQVVDLTFGGKTQTQKTDSTGRAQFAGIPANTPIKVTATVKGERLESQEFSLAEKGGVRLLLSAAAEGAPAARPDAPAVAGTVTFGADSRIAVEFDDDTLSVFYVLVIVNNNSAPVNPATAVVFDVPAEASNATALEGSSPQAQLKGHRVTVNGPFKPGRTSVQIAFQLPPAGGTRVLEQTFPVAFEGVTVAVQQPGGVQLASAQVQQQQVVAIDNRHYIMASGPALAAGRALTMELSGLPHHPAWPRMLALVLAVGILLGGAWMAISRPHATVAARRGALEGERDRLFAELVRVEEGRRAGRLDEASYVERRTVLMADLGRVYGELDSAAPLPAHAADRGTTA